MDTVARSMISRLREVATTQFKRGFVALEARGRYRALRAASVLLRPVLGERAPLRGFEVDVGAYARRTGATFVASSSPGLGVAVLPRGRVLFDYGVVVTAERMLLADVSPQLGLPPNAHVVLLEPQLPPMTRFNGRLAVLSSTAHQRYYHWMFDVLPRLDLLQEVGVAVDAYLINTEIDYQQETVQRLSIAPVVSPTNQTHIEADELVVPTLPEAIGNPSLHACNFLRRSLLPPTPPEAGRRRLYLTRRDAITRRVQNEEEVFAALSGLGFELVELQGMSVAEQALLFASAEMVVGPHGGGMTNIVFSPSRSGLLEFFTAVDFMDCFEIIAGHREMYYRRLDCPSVSRKTHDLRVDVPDMVEAVRLMLSQLAGDDRAGMRQT